MNKLVILGKLSTKFDAPFKNKNYDIWTMNLHKDHNRIPRIDTCFDLHKIPQNPKADILREDFPFEDCKKLLGGNYFNNTVSYLIAYAILQGYKEIHLYGMRFSSDHERRHGEFINVQCLLAFAIGKGIKICAPSDYVMIKDLLEYKSTFIDVPPIEKEIKISSANTVRRTVGVINQGYRNILLCGYKRVNKPLLFYGSARCCNIRYNNFNLEPFPDYDQVNGKDFDIY